MHVFPVTNDLTLCRDRLYLSDFIRLITSNKFGLVLNQFTFEFQSVDIDLFNRGIIICLRN